MTDEVLARKVADVLARVDRVRELLPPTYEDFEASRTVAEALVLNLFLALQSSSDLALRAVAARGIGVPGSAREGFELLGRAGILDGSLARRLAASVGLRNRIAHQYGSLDLRLVFEAARDDLGDLEALAAAVADMSDERDG